MDACTMHSTGTPIENPDLASELETWFAVAGDMDDFIYYDDSTKAHSEK